MNNRKLVSFSLTRIVFLLALLLAVKANGDAFDPIGSIAHYDIWRSSTNSLTNAIQVTNWQTGTTWNDTEAEPGNQYFYWARKMTADSERSNEISSFPIKVYVELLCPNKSSREYPLNIIPVKVVVHAKNTDTMDSWTGSLLVTLHIERPGGDPVTMSWPLQLTVNPTISTSREHVFETTLLDATFTEADVYATIEYNSYSESTDSMIHVTAITPGINGPVFSNSYSDDEQGLIHLEWDDPLEDHTEGSGSSASVYLDWPSNYVVFTDNTNVSDSNIYDGNAIVIDNCVVNIDGEHEFLALHIINEGMLIHTPTYTGGMNLAITENVFIDTDSSINVSGMGYAPNQGPGVGKPPVHRGPFGGGGGYGGAGGAGNGDLNSGGQPYGSLTEPNDLGSGGGGTNASGGGAIRLVVGNTLTIDGQILANGHDSTWIQHLDPGAGSGGSVWIEAQSINGSGLISSNGGVGEASGGGGAGGRIAIYYENLSFEPDNITARGGVGWNSGGAGTIFIKQLSKGTGDLIIDNTGIDGALTPLLYPAILNEVTVKNNAKLDLAGSNKITTVMLHVSSGGIIYLQNLMSVLADVSIDSGGLLTHHEGQKGFNVTAWGDVTIGTGGAIDVSYMGYAPNQGPGVGNPPVYGSPYGGGGGYGGIGGAGYGDPNSGGQSYGSFTEPNDLGSGGGGINASGGGAIRLAVANTLTIDGHILANGQDSTWIDRNDPGAGSGGSICIEAKTVNGSGLIFSNGGTGEAGGGGGAGGRIAIHYENLNFDPNNITAFGGIGYSNGAAGTIFLKQLGSNGRLICDNNSVDGALTPLLSPAVLDEIIIGDYGKFDLSDNNKITTDILNILEDGILYLQNSLQAGDVNIATGGLLTHHEGQKGFNVTAWGDVTIGTGGTIDVSCMGHGPNQGPGAGNPPVYGGPYGGGGGYGGIGGAGNGDPNSGGQSYGSLTEPNDLGSGGGGINASGGGAIRLVVGNTLTIDGQILADGQDSTWIDRNDPGAGSGGSICIEAHTLNGSGLISANGGVGEAGGGGGAGGRIAIYYENLNFDSNNITANGGIGYNIGEGGTEYTRINCPSELPQPDLESVIIIHEDKIFEGYPFTVFVAAKNDFAWGGIYSAINTSVVYQDGSHNLSIDHLEFFEWADIVYNNSPNQTNIYDPNGDLIGLNEDHFVEAVDNIWLEDESHLMKFKVTPDKPGTLLIRARATLRNGITGSFLNDYSVLFGTSSFDQNSWEVIEFEVEVKEHIPGDFEPDGDVDFADFATLASAWQSRRGEQSWIEVCNIGEPDDDIIDMVDLDVFIRHWLEIIE